MRSPLDLLVTARVLSMLANPAGHDAVVDAIIMKTDGAGTKNVCARVSEELAADIDDVVNALGISKRVFLEAAFIEAVNSAQAIMEREGFQVEGEQ